MPIGASTSTSTSTSTGCWQLQVVDLIPEKNEYLKRQPHTGCRTIHTAVYRLDSLLSFSFISSSITHRVRVRPRCPSQNDLHYQFVGGKATDNISPPHQLTLRHCLATRYPKSTRAHGDTKRLTNQCFSSPSPSYRQGLQISRSLHVLCLQVQLKLSVSPRRETMEMHTDSSQPCPSHLH